jgi:hypothetical protein
MATWSAGPCHTRSPSSTIGVSSPPRASSSPASASGLKIRPSIACRRSPATRLRSRSGCPSVWSISTVQDRRSAACTTRPASSAKYGDCSSGTASAIAPDRPLRNCRAARFGL